MYPEKLEKRSQGKIEVMPGEMDLILIHAYIARNPARLAHGTAKTYKEAGERPKEREIVSPTVSQS